jgi:hypothetical protein
MKNTNSDVLDHETATVDAEVSTITSDELAASHGGVPSGDPADWTTRQACGALLSKVGNGCVSKIVGIWAPGRL